MVPSSFMISQHTPTGSMPAMRRMSTVPSVCPARRMTPPSTARSGKQWPGCTKSSSVQRESASFMVVMERSKALMPVVMPSFASTLTVKAVCSFSVLCWVCMGSPRASTRSGAMGTQISPRACVAMKLIFCGVANWPAHTRSTSFSRCGSSVMRMSLPMRKSSSTSSSGE